MKINKKFITPLVLIGAIVIIFFIVIYVNLSPKTPVSLFNPNLNFSTGLCDSNIDPDSQPIAGILSQTWKNQNTLVVEGYVKTVCGGATITGDFTLEGNNLTLKYNIKTGDSVTMCNCPHKLIYEISDIENKDYSVSIVSG